MDKPIRLETILLQIKNDVAEGKADIWERKSLYAETKLCTGGKYQLSDLCCVAENTTVDDNNECLPSEINSMGWGLYCYGQNLVDIVSAAVQQKPGASAQELLYALNYYMDNDSFIDFSKVNNRPEKWHIGIFPKFSAEQLKHELITRKSDVLNKGQLLEYPSGTALVESGNSSIVTLCDLISFRSEWALYICISLPAVGADGYWGHILYHKQLVSPIANIADKKLKQPRLTANMDAFSQAFAGTDPSILLKYLQWDYKIRERQRQWEEYMSRRNKQKGWKPIAAPSTDHIRPEDQYCSGDWRQVFDFLNYLSFPFQERIVIL